MEKVISETVSATSSATPRRFTVKASMGGPRVRPLASTLRFARYVRSRGQTQSLLPLRREELRDLVGLRLEVEVLGVGVVLGVGEERHPEGLRRDPRQRLLPH